MPYSVVLFVSVVTLQMHLLSEEEVAKLKKRQQRAAKRKQREKEVKRLHAAQEIQQKLEEVEMRQREIERLGVEIEKALNGEDAAGELQLNA